MSYLAAAGKSALENAAKSTKWSGGHKGKQERREAGREAAGAALKGQQREELFYWIFATVCVCCMQPPTAAELPHLLMD